MLIAQPGVAFEEVQRVLSHPVALAQCEGFFRSNPRIEAVPVYDTAGAVERVISSGSREQAAIASRRAASVYGGAILAEALEDHKENYTRFLVITQPGAAAGEEAAPFGYKTSIVFTAANRPGALYDCLGPFARRGIDLSKIASRPRRGAPFEYSFYVDLIGRAGDAPVAEALDELSHHTLSLRVFGSYPRHGSMEPQ
jgi:prephenate dehydratase